MRLICLLLPLLILLANSQECHYSCATCVTKAYSGCNTCPYSQALTYTIFNDPLQGTCASIRTGTVNVAGIVYLIILVVACVLIFS